MYICIVVTVRFNQSAYNVTENSGITQLFLILNIPSSFNETVQLINTDVDTDNSANGMMNHQICYVYVSSYVLLLKEEVLTIFLDHTVLHFLLDPLLLHLILQ